MINFQRGRTREELEINLIPLIDVLLVILIFLMVTTTYSKYSELQINLPQGDAGQAAALAHLIEVGVDADGRYTINNQVVPYSDVAHFAQQLKSAAGATADPVIAIGADATATHQSVVNIMAASRLAGFTHITFTTQSKAGE